MYSWLRLYVRCIYIFTVSLIRRLKYEHSLRFWSVECGGVCAEGHRILIEAESLIPRQLRGARTSLSSTVLSEDGSIHFSRSRRDGDRIGMAMRIYCCAWTSDRGGLKSNHLQVVLMLILPKLLTLAFTTHPPRK